MWFLFSLLGSFFLCALAQPDISPVACVVAAVCGYGWFWSAAIKIGSKLFRFIASFLWFGSVAGWHLNWFLADRYVGGTIVIFVLLAAAVLGCFFALFTLLVKKELKWRGVLALSALWTISEWARLFVLSGFSWDPIGLPLSGTLYGMQMASIGGTYGLTFWVVLTNLMAFKFFSSKTALLPLAALSLIPYVFGFLHVTAHDRIQKNDPKLPLNVCLVQTALLPEQKCELTGMCGHGIPPLEQWERILAMLKAHQEKPIDLIVLSEAVVPYGTDLSLFTFGDIADVFESVLNVKLPYDKSLPAGNASFAHMIADYFDADLIAGFEDYDDSKTQSYNAAVFFKAKSRLKERYAKRVLVPLGEYIPFTWCKKFLAAWGIQDSFTPGKSAKVFEGKEKQIGVSICYEETYGQLMRENKLQGAQMLANLTNDVWYPYSRLPIIHYMHGRLRAVELGLPVVRACNTGVTCGIDSSGRTVAKLDYEKKGYKASPGVLYLQLPTYTYSTPYTFCGDKGIIGMCLGFVLLGIRRIKD
jgi:apolipoprotein N-acyltransferase